MLTKAYRPRLTVEITEEQKARLDRCISQHGLRKPVFGRIVDNLCDLVEKYGENILGVVLGGDLTVEELMKILLKPKEEVDGHDRQLE